MVALLPPSGMLLTLPLLVFELIQPEGGIIVIKGLLKGTYFIETGPSRKEGIDMFTIKFDDYGEILDGDLNLFELLVGTSHDIVGPYISLIDVEEAMTILNGFMKEMFFHVRCSSNEQCFAMLWVDLQLGRTN